MNCPFCSTSETKVIDSRLANDGQQVRRRRECANCAERFTTFETAELVMPRVVKSDARREPFNEDKLRAGLLKGLERRPVSTENIEIALSRIVQAIRAGGEREISSRYIGELVMEQLLQLDQVAYVRFASVYKSFEDVSAFQDIIEKLKAQSSNGVT